MNKYQKLICQMAKDDREKLLYKILGVSFRRNRNSIRQEFQGEDLRKIRVFKNWNKGNEI